MAIAIKSIPVLKDKAASSFVNKANSNSAKRASIDFSKQVRSANKILQKSTI